MTEHEIDVEEERRVLGQWIARYPDMAASFGVLAKLTDDGSPGWCCWREGRAEVCAIAARAHVDVDSITGEFTYDKWWTRPGDALVNNLAFAYLGLVCRGADCHRSIESA